MNCSKPLQLLMLLGGLAASANSSAVQTNAAGKYVWTFHSGLPWPGGYTQSTGKPLNMLWAKAEYDATFFDRIANALPESRINSAFLTDDAGANITLKEPGEVFVTFIHEGAGYLNAFGYFTYDKNNPPKNKNDVREIIVFPNLSYPQLAAGHRIRLGNFPAGTSIGFFLAANGFASATGVKNTASPFYYSLKGLNPDPTDALRQHNVLLVDPSTSEVIMGFEDLPRQTGDNDFNDAIFSVKVTPATALQTTSLNLIPAKKDADSDGVSDGDDEFPTDFYRASSTWYPSQQTWETLAFEDNWPRVGDYDLNDLVVREKVHTIFNARSQVVGFTLSGFIDARGAANHNGLGLRLQNIAAANVKSTQLSIAGINRPLVLETKQTNPVMLLWDDTHLYTATGGTGPCSHFNTVKTCPSFPSVPFELTVELAAPVDQLNHAQFDWFLFQRDYRGREIHFADYPPTDRFDRTQFGKLDDTSSPTSGRYFRTANNLPWAIKIPGQWRYPREYIDVLWAYPEYENWVESAGTQSANWYTNLTNLNHYY